MLKWKYGNYQFTINPNSQNSSMELVGDVARTLIGTLISQPSFLQESYDISAVFFQARSRSLGQVSLANAIGIEQYNNQFYALNKVNDRIDIYNQSFVFTSSIQLTAITNKNYKGLDVVSDGIWIICDNSGSDSIVKINFSGTILTGPIAPTGITALTPVGIEYMAGYLWVLRPTGKIDKIRPVDMVTVSTIVIQYGLYYNGLSSDGKYLIIGNNDSYSKIYHIDYTNGRIVNQITFSDILSIADIAYDGKRFYAINSSYQLQSIAGNTVELDIYSLRNEIILNKFVDLIDDMGVIARVFASEFSSKRRIEFEHMYEVSMSIKKINRG